jgi:hypothetical protein
MGKVALFGSLLLLCTVCHRVFGFTDGLLPNGNFEQGPLPSELKGTQVVSPTGIPSWQISGFVEYIPSGKKQGDMLLVVPEGSYAVRLGNEASIKQRLSVTRGLRYSISFSAARTCAQSEQINVTASRQSGFLPMQTLYSSSGWDSYAWAWLATSDDEEVVIHNPGVNDDPACGPLIDSVAVKALNSPRRTNKNLIKNGDFEEGPFILPNTNWGVLIPSHVEDDHSALPGWMVDSLKAVRYIDSSHFSVPQGHHAIELLAGRESSISQVFRTVPNRSYVLSFSVGDASNACKGSLMIEAYAGKETVKVAYESNGTGGAKKGLLQFRATADHTRLMFYSSYYNMRSDDLSTLCGPVLDNVLVVSVRSPPSQRVRG